MPEEASALFGATHPTAGNGQFTVTTDGEDTLHTVAPLPIALDTLHSTELDAPTDRLAAYTTGMPPFRKGLEPQPRPELPGNDTGIMALLMALFLLLTFNSRHHSTLLKTFTQDLLKVRTRSNVFDDHTVSESRVMISMIMTLCVCEGILAYSAAPMIGIGFSLGIFKTILILCGAAAIYYAAQLAAYATAGYLFTTPEFSSQWLRGFNASQSLLGLCLIIPTLAVLFSPERTELFLVISAALYIAARIVFLCKGFRIFYHNYFSLIYFILYLCTLEIVPLIIIYRIAVSICKH